MDKIEEIKELKSLLDQGAITKEEYQELKSQLLIGGDIQDFEIQGKETNPSETNGSIPADETFEPSINKNESNSSMSGIGDFRFSNSISETNSNQIVTPKNKNRKRIYLITSLIVIILASIIATFIFDSINQNKKKGIKNDLYKMNLIGKIKSCRNIYYAAKLSSDKLIKIGKQGEIFITFNEKGNKIEYCEYDSNGIQFHKETYKYDEEGNKIEYCEYKGVKIQKREEYKYDDKSNLIEKYEYNSDGSIYIKEIYKYDNEGNKVECYDYLLSYKHKDTYLITRHTYAYYGKSKLIAEYFGYKSNGSLDEVIESQLNHKIEYKYDERGNLIEEASEDYNNKFKYDEKGNKIEYYRKNSLTRIFDTRETFKHNEKGNIIEYCKYDANGNLTEKKAYKYDEKFNVSEYSIYDSQGNIGTYSYTYKLDDKGNIIEKWITNHTDIRQNTSYGTAIDFSKNTFERMIEENIWSKISCIEELKLELY